MIRVLILDDELAHPANASSFRSRYAIPGIQFDFCASLHEAEAMEYWAYALLLLDIRFEGEGDDHGIRLLEQIRRRVPRLPVVMLSSRTDPDVLIRSWDSGANSYVVKWSSNRRFHADLKDRIARFARSMPVGAILGEAPATRRLRETINNLAQYDISVLLLGATGTGKELAARALHAEGRRKNRPFIAVNCGAIPASLIESELFGHVRGAFTGAVSDRRGKVESADRGVLFLDEIGDLPSELQVKILRLLDTGEFARVGDDCPRKADLRVIAATNRCLDEMIEKRAFREDLYYRLNAFTLKIPSLVERIDDIPILAQHFLGQFKGEHPEKHALRSFSAECMAALQAHSWPGNIRELRNAVERAAVLCAGPEIRREFLPESVFRGVPSVANSTQHLGPNSESILGGDSGEWPAQRLIAEIQLALAAKQRVKAYKGRQWKAEFMRLMYPHCKAANAKGFDDLVKRLTQGPWGEPRLAMEDRTRTLLNALRE